MGEDYSNLYIEAIVKGKLRASFEIETPSTNGFEDANDLYKHTESCRAIIRSFVEHEQGDVYSQTFNGIDSKFFAPPLTIHDQTQTDESADVQVRNNKLNRIDLSHARGMDSINDIGGWIKKCSENVSFSEASETLRLVVAVEDIVIENLYVFVSLPRGYRLSRDEQSDDFVVYDTPASRKILQQSRLNSTYVDYSYNTFPEWAKLFKGSNTVSPKLTISNKETSQADTGSCEYVLRVNSFSEKLTETHRLKAFFYSFLSAILIGVAINHGGEFLYELWDTGCTKETWASLFDPLPVHLQTKTPFLSQVAPDQNALSQVTPEQDVKCASLKRLPLALAGLSTSCLFAVLSYKQLKKSTIDANN